ncbi:MAG: diguanylate cyclase [Candidatus Rokubacteria bacterium]|nr:diguanylate cyclase [Candidatus Rokubacteria bacterium]
MSRSALSSLRSRLLLLVLLAFLPALALILVTAWEQRQLAAAGAEEDVLRLARLAAAEPERVIEGARSLLTGLAQLPDVQAPAAQACSAQAAAIHRRFPIYTNLGAISAAGDVFCSAVPLRGPVSVADRGYVRRTLETRDFVVSGYVVDRVSGRPSLALTSPAVDPAGTLRAVVFVGLDLAWLPQLVKTAQLPTGSSYLVSDAAGLVLARHPDSSGLLGQSVPEAPLLQAIRRQEGEGKAQVTGTDGVRRFVAWTPLRGLPPADRLYVSVGISRDAAFVEANRVLLRNLLSLALVGAVALAVAALGGHLIVFRRLRTLVRAAELVSAGDLGARARVEGTDEIAVLGRSFDAMAERLAAMVKGEQEAKEDLEERVSELDLLNRLGELLQACLTLEEAYAVIERVLKDLFRFESGAVFACSASRSLIEAVARWGAAAGGGGTVFAMEECWALRSGRPHLVADTGSGPLCTHLPTPLPAASICVPLVAQGEALGLLYVGTAPLGTPNGRPLSEARRRLAEAVAEQVALGLANVKLREVLRSQSIRDPLTGLFNRRYMEETLEREVRRSQRAGRPMAVIMADIDHFKQINDNFDHDAGDAMLREMGALLQRNLRREDIACRYGGEEFVLVLHDASLEDAARRAEDLRDGVKQMRVSDRGRIVGPVTLSLGVATFPEHGVTGEALLHAADAALYHAKREGRDRVTTAEPATDPRPGERF